jgi:hypothetical protein
MVRPITMETTTLAERQSNPLMSSCLKLAPRRNKLKVRAGKVYSFHNVELPRDLQDFYLKKKPASFLKNLKYTVIADLEECHKLWDEFSPKESLFDLWDFRVPFYQIFQPQLHFILLRKGERNVGLLPLWHDNEQKQYHWFGGWWHEDNKFLVKDPLFTPILFALCPEPAYLNCISSEMLSHFVAHEEFKKFSQADPKYVLDVSRFKSFEDYLKSLKKSRRHALKKERKKIEAKKPEIIIDNFSDFDNLMSLCCERFDQKISHGYKDPYDEGPIWQDSRYADTFRGIIDNTSKDYQMRMITVKIGGRVVGVDLLAIYNGCYYALVCGYDVSRCSGIGNYLNILEIEEAIKLGLKKVDLLQNSYQWKDRWFQPLPLLEYRK